MTTPNKPRGRPRRYSGYEKILSTHPAKSMNKRPIYVNGIGIYRGTAGDKVYIKVHLNKAGRSTEIPKGQLSSWSWAKLEAERDRLQGKADRNEPLEDKQSVTFKEYATGWLEIAKSYQKSYSTSMYCVTRQLIPFFGKKLLDEITVRDVNLWQAKRMKDVSPATAKRDFAMLKAILNAAIREDLIEKNPCNNANKIKGIKGRMRYWTAKELLRVLSTAQDINPEFKDFILWASLSAMRRGEIVNMKWKDIVTLDNGETKIHIPISKSDKPRHIPCNKQMMAILIRQRERTTQHDDEKVFGIYYRTVGRHMQAIQLKLKEEGITDIRFHDLRTFNISTALLAGVDPNTLTGITGHSDLQMINKHYAVIVGTAMTDGSNKSGDYIAAMLQKAQEKAVEQKERGNDVILLAAE